VHCKTSGGHKHDAHFQHLHQPRQPRLVVFIGQLSGGGREQEEGQDEDTGGEVGQNFRANRCPLRRVEGEQDNERILEQVVVEGPEKLGEEKRAEALRLQ
jgi:hypothetical protein